MPALNLREHSYWQLLVAMRRPARGTRPHAAPAQPSPQLAQSPSPLGHVAFGSTKHPARSSRASLPRFERAHSGKAVIGQACGMAGRSGGRAGRGSSRASGRAGERVCGRALRRRRAIWRAGGWAPGRVGGRVGWLGGGTAVGQAEHAGEHAGKREGGHAVQAQSAKRRGGRTGECELK